MKLKNINLDNKSLILIILGKNFTTNINIKNKVVDITIA
jgi:hypothetical protein